MRLAAALVTLLLLFLPSHIPPSQADASGGVPEREGSLHRTTGIYFRGVRIGRTTTSFVPLDRARSEVREETALRVNVLGVPQQIEISSRYTLKGYRPSRFSFTMRSPAGSFKVDGRYTSEGGMVVLVSTPATETQFEASLGEEAFVFPSLYRWLAARNPAPGDLLKVALFDPAAALEGAGRGPLEAEVEVIGRERLTVPLGTFDTLSVRLTYRKTTSRVWIDADGLVVKEVSSAGFTALAEPEDAGSTSPSGEVDLVAATAVSSNVPIDNPSRLRELRLQPVEEGAWEGFDLEDGWRQRMEDGWLVIRTEDVSSLRGYTLPYRGTEVAAYLAPSPAVRSDAPDIVAASQAIVGGETNSVVAARKLMRWVYKTVEKEPTVSFPNAVDVLKTRRGDCNEHAVLYAALARAAGIPTRIAMGLVYLGGKFYYHAWDEVYLGRWVTVDPTLGQMPADASHVRFVDGEPSAGSEMARLMGRPRQVQVVVGKTEGEG